MKTEITSTFYQDPPQLSNTFESDSNLRKLLETFPGNYQDQVAAHLNVVGGRAAGEWLRWSKEAESNKPFHVPYNPWGQRIDDVVTHPAWKHLENASATDGIVAAAYERKFGEFSRVYQSMLLYLFHPSSAFFSCPLAMTDGAARAIELHGDDYLKKHAFPKLTSRDPETFWTSGQWMTERTGGSDVSGTSTIAKKTGDPKIYNLHGTKWFTSASTSNMALTLARIEGDAEGSRGLSLFYLELRDHKNQLNQIQVNRLKDKLGTDALPTAELSLTGTEARLIGNPSEGVKRISSVLNITRIYNSICALGHMRRSLDLALDYAKRRRAFGALIIDHALHRKTLSDLETEFTKCFNLTFFVAGLLGKEEVNKATEAEKKLLRALTPIVKLYTAKKCMLISSECVEAFGGAGYIEDTGLPRILRDAQVFSIWEGTTNILAMDFLRVCEKENAMETIGQYLNDKGLESGDLKLLMNEKFRDVENARELVFLVADLVNKTL